MFPLLMFAVFYFIWMCVPMIPAIFIYRLFPKDTIGVKGPLGALTINASGAFAGYIIVFALAYPIVDKSEDALGTALRPVWTVKASVKLEDVSGKPVDLQFLKGINVQLRPDYYTTANELVQVAVPEYSDGLPKMVISIPQFGSAVTDINDRADQDVDDFRKIIKIKTPIVIKRQSQFGAGVQPLF